MHSFRLVPAAEGPRREFKITFGLRAGYGSAGRIYHLEEAIRTAHRWMRERAARGAPRAGRVDTAGNLGAEHGLEEPGRRVWIGAAQMDVIVSIVAHRLSPTGLR
jgi:hypothetical protein